MNSLLRKLSVIVITTCTWLSAFGQSNPQTQDNNQICMDPIVGVGRGPFINQTRTSGLCVACSGSSATAVVDGNLGNAATIDLGVLALGGYRISVRDSLQYYPGGNEVGFIIRYRNSGLLGLLSVALLNQIQIRTYRAGNPVPVETASFLTGSGLLKTTALSGSGDGKQRLSFVTTQAFDEVELVYTGPVSIGNALDVFYAFEGPANCARTCDVSLLSGTRSATATSGSSSPFLGGCLLGSISNVSGVIDADSTGTPATITSTVGLACTRFIEVGTPTSYSAGTEAGYFVDLNGGLLDLTLLGGVTISTYENGDFRESFSGSSLVAASVLDGSSRARIGFKSTLPFNSIRISLAGLATVAVTLRVFYAYIVTDSDQDGVPDCMDRCATGSDLLDTDGDGVPNACDTDTADLSVTKTSSSATATVGQSVTFTVTASRTAQFNATGVVLRDSLPAGLTYQSHTATTGTVYNPTTGRWTIGSALAGSVTSAVLTITARVDSVGVLSNVAEVIRSFETDPNSVPGNGNFAEDDIASACVSIPVRLCEGESLRLTAPANLTAGVEWFRTVGNVTTSVATTPTFSASLSGSYSFTATGLIGCVSGNCCPVILVIDPAPAPVIVASLTAVCAGSSTSLSVGNVVAGTTYRWNTGEVSSSISVSPQVTTIYSVTATIGNCAGVTSVTIVVNQPPVQAPITAICGPNGSADYSFAINPATLGSSAAYFVTVGSLAEAGPFPYGTLKTFTNNSGNLTVVIRDATTGCSVSVPVTAPTNCLVCPPKVCVPILISRIR